MKELIEGLNKEKATNEALIKQLKEKIYLLTVKNKSIEKAIKALNDGQGEGKA